MLHARLGVCRKLWRLVATALILLRVSKKLLQRGSVCSLDNATQRSHRRCSPSRCRGNHADHQQLDSVLRPHEQGARLVDKEASKPLATARLEPVGAQHEASPKLTKTLAHRMRQAGTASRNLWFAAHDVAKAPHGALRRLNVGGSILQPVRGKTHLAFGTV